MNIKDTEEYKSSIKLLNKITMNKEFVPYEQAVALKELGFDEPCIKYWDGIGEYFDQKDWFNWNQSENFISIPLYQQAFRWFRENYGLEHKILRDSYGCRYQITKVIPTSLEDIECNGQYSNTSYEEAELHCLIKLIEIVKNK